MSKRLTRQEVDAAICMYTKDGLSCAKIGATLGVSDVAIRNQLKNNGVDIRSISQARRSIPCNHQYFSQPLDERRAYWIGFMLADGCVNEKRYGQTAGIYARLTSGDRHHLEKLAIDLGSKHKIIEVEGCAQLAISSAELADGLIRYGVVPRKSAQHQCSPLIPDSLLPHYFRGYFDGNGGISRHLRSRWSISCSAGEHFLTAFRDWISGQIGGHPAKISFRDGIHRMAWAGTHRCREILDLMYQDADVYLDRKMLLYGEIVRDAEASPRQSYNRW